MEINEAIDRYKDFAEGRLSDNTVSNYISTIKRFINWCKTDLHLTKEEGRIKTTDEITFDIIAQFVKREIKSGAGGKSHNVYMTALRSFFKYLYENKHITDNLATMDVCQNLNKNMTLKRRGIRQPEDITEEVGKVIPRKDINSILSATNNMQHGKRNRLMIEVALQTGFRCCDLVLLRVNDFNFETGYVKKALYKTSTVVNFIVGSDLIEKIFQYTKDNGLSDNDFLFQKDPEFIRRFGYRAEKSEQFISKNISTGGFKYIFRETLLAAGLPYGKENGGYSPHDLRRTNATILCKNGMRIDEIQKRLGHANITTTQKYLLQGTSKEDEDRTSGIIKKAFNIE